MSVTFTSNVSLDESFNRYVQAELIKYVNDKMNLLGKNAEPIVKEIIRKEMYASPEFLALANGRLRQELGIVDGVGAVTSIIEAIIQFIEIKTKPANDEILGGLQIGIFKEDFSDALSATGAEYISTNKKGRQTLIRWLDWMLTKGDGIIIQGYEIIYGYEHRIGKFSGSRTGPIMIKRSFEGVKGRYNRAKGRSGPSSWSMPREFAGSSENNWFTKVGEKIGPEIQDLLEKGAEQLFR